MLENWGRRRGQPSLSFAGVSILIGLIGCSIAVYTFAEGNPFSLIERSNIAVGLAAFVFWVHEAYRESAAVDELEDSEQSEVSG